jgi:hypothetical protein
MDMQQIVVWVIVAVAAVYLLRNTLAAWKRMRNPKSGGCASGCGKCGYAPKDVPEPNAAFIPLSSVKQKHSR